MQEDNTPIVETEEAAWNLEEGQDETVLSDEPIQTEEVTIPPVDPAKDETPLPVEETTPAETVKAEEAAPPGEVAQPKKNKVPAKQRIADLTKKRRTAERERDQAVTEQQRLKEQIKELQTATDKTADDVTPNEDGFESYEDYITAKTRHEVKQELQQERESTLLEKKEQADQTVTTTTEQASTDAKELFKEELISNGSDSHEDFEAVAFDPKVPLSPGMAEILKDLSEPAEVLYALGNNHEEAARIYQMENPISQAVAMAQLASVPAAKKIIPKTNTPEPINPIRPSATTRKNPEKMSHKEYREWRESRE